MQKQKKFNDQKLFSTTLTHINLCKLTKTSGTFEEFIKCGNHLKLTSDDR